MTVRWKLTQAFCQCHSCPWDWAGKRVGEQSRNVSLRNCGSPLFFSRSWAVPCGREGILPFLFSCYEWGGRAAFWWLPPLHFFPRAITVSDSFCSHNLLSTLRIDKPCRVRTQVMPGPLTFLWLEIILVVFIFNFLLFFLFVCIKVKLKKNEPNNRGSDSSFCPGVGLLQRTLRSDFWCDFGSSQEVNSRKLFLCSCYLDFQKSRS